ncbi:23S rRNA (uracil(1939)-C(5))-methyltransferase RlmD [Weeksellaceae bacterium TAE3-ERU29]|nr:23S rRNA (uracil(1939)-C(5))-methyltransferase RlmD [Weeksellaceae bacterium TAE3-ERU29]
MARKERKPLILENIYLETAGAKGASIGKAPDGKTIFVRNAVPGDTVDVRVLKKKKRYLEGKAISVHNFSELRTEPECEHFGICGGCKWQNMEYSAQLHFKEKEVLDHLSRIGGVDISHASKILGSEDIYFYRNKLEFSFSNQRWITEEEIKNNNEITDRNALGFHIPGMWSKILDIKKCWLQRDPSNNIRLEIKDYANKKSLEFFNPVEQSGFLRTLMIRTTTTGEVMVLVQFYREQKTERENLLNHLKEKFPQITSLLYAINPKGNDSVYDLDIKVFAGQDHITEVMEDLKFKIGPKSFYQTNPVQAYELYKVTRDFAELSGEELVYDLYTGTGTIAQFVSKKAKKVVGVESVQEAIDAAKANAKANGIENCDFYCGDMKDIFTNEFVQQNGTPDVIITDPPRDGMHPKVVENILNIKPKRVVYVSCNSATQARDLALMKEDYEIIKIQPVDMFPQTYHVENVVLLERKN